MLLSKTPKKIAFNFWRKYICIRIQVTMPSQKQAVMNADQTEVHFYDSIFIGDSRCF